MVYNQRKREGELLCFKSQNNSQDNFMRKYIQNIKVIFSDVDGTLTDGSLYYSSSSGDTFKRFHAHDGQGIKMWQQTGRFFGFLSARECPAVRKRATELRVNECGLNIFDKRTWMKDWLKAHELNFQNLAYIGDDINDLEVIREAGYSAAPRSAIKKIQEETNYVCDKEGGEGAVREFIDHLLQELSLIENTSR